MDIHARWEFDPHIGAEEESRSETLKEQIAPTGWHDFRQASQRAAGASWALHCRLRFHLGRSGNRVPQSGHGGAPPLPGAFAGYGQDLTRRHYCAW